jgi:hypothetical protein
MVTTLLSFVPGTVGSCTAIAIATQGMADGLVMIDSAKICLRVIFGTSEPQRRSHIT